MKKRDNKTQSINLENFVAPDVQLHVLLEQFKTLREEIHIRIKQHTQLVTFKIVALGFIWGFIFDKFVLKEAEYASTIDKSSIFGYIVWLIPLIAIICDLLVAGNLRALYNMGPYIMEYIEPQLRKISRVEIKFWEEGVASKLPKFYGYKTLDVIAIWVLTFLSLVLVFLDRLQTGLHQYDIIGSLIMFVGTAFALYYLVRSLTMKREYGDEESDETIDEDR